MGTEGSIPQASTPPPQLEVKSGLRRSRVAKFLLKHPPRSGTPWARTREPRALSTKQVPG